MSFDQGQVLNHYEAIEQIYHLPRGEVTAGKHALSSSLRRLLKKTLQKVIYPPLAFLFERQSAFNLHAVRILQDLRQLHDDLERNFLEQNHYRYTEVQALEKNFLQQNHSRFVEHGELNHKLHHELTALKQEISALLYSQLHMRLALDSLEDEFRMQTEAMQSLEQQLEFARAESANSTAALEQTAQALQETLQQFEQRIRKTRSSISNIRRKMAAQVTASSTFSGYNGNGSHSSAGSEFDAMLFELTDAMRGPEQEIAKYQEIYAGRLKANQPVLDVGCGRGEMLERLSREGVECLGIDLNEQMVQHCRAKGLKVEHANAVDFLSAINDGSFGSIFASHFIEHLDWNTLQEFLVLSARKLRENGVLILETPNPLGFCTLSRSFYLDPTHVRPIHPETLQRVVGILGLKIIDKLDLHPWPDHELLQTQNGSGDMTHNLQKLNDYLFAPRDYAILAQK